MQNEIQKIYKNYVKNNFITNDFNQIEVLNLMNQAWQTFNKINFFFRFKKYNGFYIYGSVGIGKTFITNLFINTIHKSKKIHFNHFMIDLHAFINNTKDNSALDTYIKKFARNYDLIFIDELHIFNIVDALLVKKIFVLFKKYKIFILISSNFKPDELYVNGLQRNDFIPFIDYILNNFKVVRLKKIKDYRRQMLNQSKTYFTPINEITTKEFNELFNRFVDKDQIHIKKIKIKSRVIRFEKCTSNIVFVSFNDLCFKNLSHDDYYNIAKYFSLFFINQVPCFTDSESDQCRRFISLIDMLYDKNCSVVILADKPISKLCQIKKLNKEFERTSSRLYEMTIINNIKNEK